MLVAGQQRIDVGRAALARLGDQRQVGRERVVVRGARGDLVGERRREVVGRQRLAGRWLAGVRVDRRDLDLPVGRDRLHLGLVVAELREVAERDELEGVAGRADLLVDLEAALELRACRTCRTGRRSRGAAPSARLWNSSRGESAPAGSGQ